MSFGSEDQMNRVPTINELLHRAVAAEAALEQAREDAYFAIEARGEAEWLLASERQSRARLEEALEQWEPVALALVRRHPVRNLDELIVATRSALGASTGDEG